MFPFWESVIEPLVRAAGTRRLLEIGALRGDTTVRVLADLAPGSEVHVIDPLPQFDPAEHEQAFPGQYVFHRDLSLNVLPDLPPVDVALIDGDHNWYTVYNELRLLRETSRREGRPLPLLVLHDVGFPYGHRDLYYEPSQIPEEFRQPHAKQGIHPELKKLTHGGINSNLDNAVESGGPRNGVRRALEDFLEEHDRPFRKVILPTYFGLAIVADQDRLDLAPEIGRRLDHHTSAQGRSELLHLAERIRISGVLQEHRMLRIHNEALARRTGRALELLKGALLDEHNLENEVRIEYLTSLPPGTAPDIDALRDPARRLPLRTDRLRNARAKGLAGDEARNLSYFPHTDMGRAQLDRLQAALEQVTRALDQGDGIAPVEGDVAECGVGRGGGGIFMRGFLDAHELEGRTVWVVDDLVATDPGAPATTDPEAAIRTFRADLNQVRDGFHRFGLLDERVRFVQGRVGDSLRDAPIGPLSVLRIGGSALGESLETALEQLLPRVVPGGHVLVEGTSRARVEKVVTAVRERLGITEPLERVDWNSVAWVVSQPVSAATAPEHDAGRAAARVAVPPPPPAEQIDLSVVVVVYEMRREAARTLQSLARTYQTGTEHLDYEVLVVDNGSSAEQRLSAEEVAAYGPEFRLLAVEDAPPSPTVALNRGIAEARGRAVALMIDGAHVLTPGVLSQAALALDTYDPAIVAVQQWYVGPGQQGDAQLLGYDQATEDRLFQRIQWPVDGYRLFEVGHFIGDRDWFDGMVESNCLVVPRALLEQVGGFDDSFSTPGGGYANLELFERLGQTPGLTVVSLLGEGSFHQVHGGTTTNIADAAARRGVVFSYGQDFRDLRGRALDGITAPIRYMGSMATKAARRTRSRREVSLRFDAARDPVTHDQADDAPGFVADELKIGAIEAVWGSGSWREASWLGLPAARYPADLHVYQELVAAGRPSVVVLVGDDEGLAGRAHLVASVLDGLGTGRVVAVGSAAGQVPPHPRITAVEAPGDDAGAAEQVRGIVGDEPALVVIGLGAHVRALGAFEAYAPLVPVGGYVVVENTVVNGRPVASSFGPGPHEAVVGILERHPEFAADPTMERYTVTFNRGGYLKRLAPT